MSSEQLDIDIDQLNVLIGQIREREINNTLYKFIHQYGLLEEEKVLLKNYINFFPKSEECSICQEKFGFLDKICELPCGHRFHQDCVNNWFKQKTTCPLCRYNIRDDSGDIFKTIIMTTMFRNIFFKIVPYVYYIKTKYNSIDNEDDEKPETWVEYIKNKLFKYLNY